MSFCSREQPTVVCQEIAIDVDAASDLKVRARIDLSGIEGRPLRYNRDTPGEVQTFERRVAALGKRRSDFDMRACLRDRVRWR